MKRFFGFMSIVALSLTMSTPVWACGHGMKHDLGDMDIVDIGTVARKGKANPTIIGAEKKFQSGAYYDAIKMALSAEPTLQKRSKSYLKSKNAIVKRGARLVAISTVRLKGRVTLNRRARLTKKSSVVRKNLAWATAVLKHAAQQSKDDPELQSHLAEAYAQSSKTEDKALKILSTLAFRDLLVDAHGFAVLARLHKQNKNTEKYRAAVKRCMAISKQNALLCTGSKTVQKASLNRKVKVAKK